MNNETFGITLQYAVCVKYKLDNKISLKRIDKKILNKILKSKILEKIFKGRKPIKYLTDSKDFTSEFATKCPHNFLLANDETFSVRTFQGSGKMFAPKVVGQAGDETFNHFFGHLSTEEISRNNFKEFCLNHIDEMLPIIIDYALVSDFNCWFYIKDNNFHYEILKRGDLPELTFDYKNFSFTNYKLIA